MRSGLLLLLLAGWARSQEGDVIRAITFQDAVDLGLARNLGLESARLTALMARLRVKQEDAAFDPIINAEFGGGDSLSPSRSSLAGAAVVDVESAHFLVGATKRLRIGPTLGMQWRSDRTFTNSSFSSINPAYDTSFSISMTAPLLRGRGREANESDLRASRASAAGARYDLLHQAADLVLNIADAYWNLAYLQNRVDVLRKSVALAREIETSERRKLRPAIGRSTPLDVVKAAAETKRREVSVIQGQNDAANASDDLRRLILPFRGGKPDRVVLRASDGPGDRADLPELEQLISQALSRRPDLKQAEAEIRRLQEGVIKAQDDLRFQLDLRASVTWRGVDNTFQGGAADVVEGDTPSAEATILFTWPVGRRAARAGLRQARLALERQRVQRDSLVNDLIIDVRKARRGLRTAMREIEATLEEERAAREALEGERKRLERGSATILDVSRLEENVTDAQLRLLQARTNLERARVDVLRVSGTLIERFQIKLGPQLEPGR